MGDIRPRQSRLPGKQATTCCSGARAERHPSNERHSLGKPRPFIPPNHSSTHTHPHQDEGNVANALQFRVSAPLSDPQGPFARLCQAAILIDRVESHVRRTIWRHKARDPEPFSTQEVDILIDELTSFSSIVSSELAAASSSPASTNPSPQTQRPHSPQSFFTYPSPLYSNPTATQPAPSQTHSPPSPTASPHSAIPSLLPPHFLVFSSIVLLYDPYCCPEDIITSGPGGPSPELPKTSASLQMQVRAVTGLRAIALSVRDAGIELLDFVMLPNNLAKVSPLVLDSLYVAMATLNWLWKEGGEESVAQALGDVKRTLARLDMRWRLARDYLGMGRYHDITIC